MKNIKLYIKDEYFKIDKKLLEKQINALVRSNMRENYKAGIHNLLGGIYDKL